MNEQEVEKRLGRLEHRLHMQAEQNVDAAMEREAECFEDQQDREARHHDKKLRARQEKEAEQFFARQGSEYWQRVGMEYARLRARALEHVSEEPSLPSRKFVDAA